MHLHMSLLLLLLLLWCRLYPLLLRSLLQRTSSVCRSTTGTCSIVGSRARSTSCVILVTIIGCDVVVPISFFRLPILRCLFRISRCIFGWRSVGHCRSRRPCDTCCRESYLELAHDSCYLLLVVHVINQGLAEHAAHPLIHGRVEVEPLEKAAIGA